jgi:hypothetical protein
VALSGELNQAIVRGMALEIGKRPDHIADWVVSAQPRLVPEIEIPGSTSQPPTDSTTVTTTSDTRSTKVVELIAFLSVFVGGYISFGILLGISNNLWTFAGIITEAFVIPGMLVLTAAVVIGAITAIVWSLNETWWSIFGAILGTLAIPWIWSLNGDLGWNYWTESPDAWDWVWIGAGAVAGAVVVAWKKQAYSVQIGTFAAVIVGAIGGSGAVVLFLSWVSSFTATWLAGLTLGLIPGLLLTVGVWTASLVTILVIAGLSNPKDFNHKEGFTFLFLS